MKKVAILTPDALGNSFALDELGYITLNINPSEDNQLKITENGLMVAQSESPTPGFTIYKSKPTVKDGGPSELFKFTHKGIEFTLNLEEQERFKQFTSVIIKAVNPDSVKGFALVKGLRDGASQNFLFNAGDWVANHASELRFGFIIDNRCVVFDVALSHAYFAETNMFQGIAMVEDVLDMPYELVEGDFELDGGSGQPTLPPEFDDGLTDRLYQLFNFSGHVGDQTGNTHAMFVNKQDNSFKLYELSDVVDPNGINTSTTKRLVMANDFKSGVDLRRERKLATVPNDNIFAFISAMHGVESQVDFWQIIGTGGGNTAQDDRVQIATEINGVNFIESMVNPQIALSRTSATTAKIALYDRDKLDSTIRSIDIDLTTRTPSEWVTGYNLGFELAGNQVIRDIVASPYESNAFIGAFSAEGYNASINIQYRSDTYNFSHHHYWEEKCGEFIDFKIYPCSDNTYMTISIGTNGAELMLYYRDGTSADSIFVGETFLPLQMFMGGFDIVKVGPEIGRVWFYGITKDELGYIEFRVPRGYPASMTRGTWDGSVIGANNPFNIGVQGDIGRLAHCTSVKDDGWAGYDIKYIALFNIT